MAQNSDILQEPSMDELLASIREIIEENAGIPQQEGQINGVDNAPRSAQSEGVMQARSRSYDATMPNLKQDIRLRDGGNSSNVASAQPHGGDGACNNGQSGNFSQNGFNGFAKSPDRNSLSMRGNGGGRGAQPVQDPMNALAERIGLRRNDSVLKNEMQGRLCQTDNPASPLPSFIAPAADNRAVRNGQSASPPVHLRNSGQPANNGNIARTRFNPAAMDAGFADNSYGQQERARAPEAKEGEQSASMRQKAGAGRSVENGPAAVYSADKYADMVGFEGNLPADVEHSTENLLRPFIAQWLDENFRGLFEKVLREEVQRFMQRSMRRG